MIEKNDLLNHLLRHEKKKKHIHRVIKLFLADTRSALTQEEISLKLLDSGAKLNLKTIGNNLGNMVRSGKISVTYRKGKAYYYCFD